MARCKECLHYKVCAKEGRLVQVDEHTWDEYNKLDDVEQFCTNYFTADVVPKSELDLLKSTITHKEEEAYNKGYTDAKKSILMDIKAIMQIIILDYKEIGAFDNAEIVGYVRDHLITELEKRYTEGEQ